MPYHECYVPRHLLSTVVRKKGKSDAKSICQIVTKSKLTLFAVCVHAKALQSCPTLCNPVDCSLPGSFVHRILRARILEYVAMPSSQGSSWPRARTRVSCIGRWVLYHQWHLGSPFNQLHAVLSRSVVSNSLWCHGLWPARLLCPWDSPGKNIEVGFHALLQGISATQGFNPSLLHCRLYSNIKFFKKKHVRGIYKGRGNRW